MSAVVVIAIWGLVAIAAAVVAGIIASTKNRDHSFWFASTFVVPPLLVFLLFLPRLKERQKRRSIDEEEDAQDPV